MENDTNKTYDEVYTVVAECNYCPFTRKPCMKEKCAIAHRDGVCSFYSAVRELEVMNIAR